MILKYIILLALVAYKVNCQNENTYFVNTYPLTQNNNNFVLSWNFTNEDIIFKIVAQTDGWVGFGLSPNGGMENSDIMLAWSDTNGNVQFRDAHTENSKSVLFDTFQNWKKILYSQNNGVTTVIFSRKLIICNADQPTSELNIDVMSTNNVIYAWGTSFGSNSVPGYHNTNRGSRSLPLLSTLNKRSELNMKEIKQFDFKVKTNLPNNETTLYECHMFELPQEWLTNKQHVVQTETIYTPETLKHIHHWLVYECDDTYETEYLVNNTNPAPAACDRNTNQEWRDVKKYCQKITFGWGIGNDLVQTFGDDMGYPIGGKSGSGRMKYFYIEMHYDNHELSQNVVLDVSMRISVTENYRPKEFGFLTVGTISSPQGMLFPPKMKKLAYNFHLRKEAMNKLYSNGPITVVAQNPHTHLAGRQLFSSVVKDNKEMTKIANNKYYNSNYQYNNWLPEPITMDMGDEISLSCVYNTEDRSQPTYAGLSTYEEMCFDFILYYPRHDELSQVFEVIDFDQWYAFFDDLNKTGMIDWKFADDYQSFFEDSMKSIENSPLNDDPEKLENLFQTFIDGSKRTQYWPGQKSSERVSRVLPKVERLTDTSCPQTTGSTTVVSKLTTGNGAIKMNIESSSLIFVFILSIYFSKAL